MDDALSQFRDAIRAAGLEPPENIEPGKLHRFPGLGKRNGNTAGWCILFEDGLGAGRIAGFATGKGQSLLLAVEFVAQGLLPIGERLPKALAFALSGRERSARITLGPRLTRA